MNTDNVDDLIFPGAYLCAGTPPNNAQSAAGTRFGSIILVSSYEQNSRIAQYYLDSSGGIYMRGKIGLASWSAWVKVAGI